MIHKADHKSDFIIFSRAIFRDTRLNGDALQILLFALSCAEGWEFSIAGLSYTLNMSEKKVMRSVKLLKDAGYITQKPRLDNNGKFCGCDWDIYEEPQADISRTAQKPQCVKTAVRENRSASSTQCVKTAVHISNNQSISNIEYKSSIETKEIHGEFSHVLLTSSEYSKLLDKLGADAEHYISTLDAYLEDHPRKHYASHYTTILNWQRKDEKKPKATTQPLKASGNPFLDMLKNMEADE